MFKSILLKYEAQTPAPLRKSNCLKKAPNILEKKNPLQKVLKYHQSMQNQHFSIFCSVSICAFLYQSVTL